MSVIIASKQEVQEYYESEALGQSKLKLLLGDLSQFNKEFDSSAEHFMIGSAVDCLLTSTQEEFDKTYYVSQVEKLPSEAIIDILKLVHRDTVDDYFEYVATASVEEGTPFTLFPEFVGSLANWEDYLTDAFTQTGWQPTWGVPAKLKNLIEKGSEYFMDLCNSFGKTVISQTQNTTIKSIVKSLETSPRTAHLFDREFLAQSNDALTVYYQFPIYFEYRKVKCKALLDMVFVLRNEEGRILEITGVDLKTMNGNTYHFPSSLRSRRYDIQAAWYTLALHHYFAVPEGSTVIKPFQFVVESTSYQGKPLTFVVSESLLKLGRYGKKAISLIDTNLFSPDSPQTEVIRQEIKGFEDLLSLYIYHTENGFNEELEIQESGVSPLLIDWNGYI